MLTFLLGMIVDIASGGAAACLAAAEAFETPPRNPTARRWAAIALSLFFLTSSMMLTAALVDCFAGRRFIAECFGWTGIVFLQLCVVCGVRYAVVNRNAVLNGDRNLPDAANQRLERSSSTCRCRNG